MADKKRKEKVKWKKLSLIAYSFATAVGYLYAIGYYGDFGIDILNYVEPIDLLLISLDNVDNVIVFSALVVPIVLPLIVLVPAGVVLIGVMVVLASLAAYSTLVLALCSGVLSALAGSTAAVRRANWIGGALRTAFGKTESRKEAGKEDVQGTEKGGSVSRMDFRRKFLHFVTTYKKMVRAHASKPIMENDYLADAKVVIRETQKFWVWIPQIWPPIHRAFVWLGGFFESKSSWRLKGWNSLGRLRQLVVVGTMAYVGCAAYLNGKFDAQQIHLLAGSSIQLPAKEASGTPSAPGAGSDPKARDVTGDGSTWPTIAWSFICPIVPLGDCGEKEPWTTAAWDVICPIVPLGDCGEEEPWTTAAWDVICPVVHLTSCHEENQEDRTMTIYAVPTTNVVSLELKECGKEGRRPQYARAILQRDVSDVAHRATSDCLVYLGATGSMQFLADFHNSESRPTEYQSDGQRDAPVVIVVSGGNGQPPKHSRLVDADPPAVVIDAGSGGVSAHACDLELVAVVGPFKTGTTDIGTDTADVQAVGGAGKRAAGNKCVVPGRREEVETVGDVKALGDLGDYGTLVLVGRADVRPINNRSFDSNMTLAQARVKVVAESLKHRGLSVLSITGGPVDSPKGADACSRVVEIYGCRASASSEIAGTTDAGEEAPSSNLEGDS